MAVDVTLQNVGSGYNLSVINSNFNAIEAALQDAVSLSGNTPNAMSGDLDMNGNDLLNVGDAVFNGGVEINGVDIGNLSAEVQAAETAAAASATAASTSAAQALQSAINAAASAGTNTPFEQQVHNATAKTTPVDADEFGIADSAASFGIKKVTWTTLYNKAFDKLGGYIDGLTEKTSLVNGDEWLIADSAASFANKKVKWSDIISTLVTSFGALIAATTAKSPIVAADLIPIADSQASNASKHIAVSDVAAFLDSRVGVKTGQLNGLILSNSTGDSVNDLVVAPGYARSSDDTTDMYLSASITKQLDVLWAVGTNAGGLSTGSITNTTYHVYLIKRPDTGVVDVLFDTSATSPTLPTNYTKYRRIGSIIRSGATILAFVQDGDDFYFNSAQTNYSQANSSSKAALSVSVPNGIRVLGYFQVGVSTAPSSSIGYIFTVYDGVNTTIFKQFAAVGQAIGGLASPLSVFTNTNSQIQFQLATSSTTGTNYLNTVGWRDTRGK